MPNEILRPQEFDAPRPRQSWALFLDIDGTLIDIASGPDAVIVPDSLADNLAAAGNWLGGALAIVSGRALAKIDDLMSPLKLPCAAEHGAVFRLPNGEIKTPDASCALPNAWRERIRTAAQNWTGVITEHKSYGIAVHYRGAPEREREVRDLLNSLAADTPAFEVLSAHMACELRHRGLTKAAAVYEFMSHPPFLHRQPVFVGDDVTDEDGFRAAREMGGLALHVNSSFGGLPSNVRQWLRTFGSDEPR